MTQHNTPLKQSIEKNSIGKTLTAQQHHKIMVEVQVLKCDTRILDPEQLIKEIIDALLDNSRYSRACNNFSAKLKMIINSIRDRTWKPSKQYQTKDGNIGSAPKIQMLQKSLGDADGSLEYCKILV